MEEQLEGQCQRSLLLQKDGNYVAALKVVQEALQQCSELQYTESEQFKKTCDRMCELCNLMAMKYLDQGDFDLAFDYLKRADLYSDQNPRLRLVTLNNFACYYRRLNKGRTALKYLESVLAIETDSPDTHMNICAVLSQLGRHDAAADHAMQSIVLLQDQAIEHLTSGSSNDRGSLLVIAYHNLAVELEHLTRMSESLKYYNKALLCARKDLPSDHKLIKDLVAIITKATQHFSQTREKEDKRRRERNGVSGPRSQLDRLNRTKPKVLRKTGTVPNLEG